MINFYLVFKPLFSQQLSRHHWLLPAAPALLLTTAACHTATRAASVAPDTAPEQEAVSSSQPTATSAANTGETAAATAEQPSYEAPPPSLPSGKPYDNTIKWATASEVDNFGFDVYRGDSPDGPFERLNAETIEGGGTTDEPRNYKFIDDTIDPYKTYYYYVEAISMNSVRERFTPVGKAGPKIKPEEEEAEPEAEEKPEDSGAG